MYLRVFLFTLASTIFLLEPAKAYTPQFKGLSTSTTHAQMCRNVSSGLDTQLGNIQNKLRNLKQELSRYSCNDYPVAVRQIEDLSLNLDFYLKCVAEATQPNQLRALRALNDLDAAKFQINQEWENKAKDGGCK